MSDQIIITPHIDDIMSKYRANIFGHPIAESALEALSTATSSSNTPQIIILTGPTGVGKSTLVKAAWNRLLHRFTDLMEADSSFVPIVSTVAVPPEKGKPFDWKDFHYRLLTGQSEPLHGRKLVIPRQRSLFLDLQQDISVHQQPEPAAVRRAVEMCLLHRKTKFVFVDQAHNMFLGKPDEPRKQFECIASLATLSDTTFILVGTYELLDILEQSAQLTRRSQIIHYPRYDLRISNDRKAFRLVLGHLEETLSKYIPTQLVDEAEYFYKKSAGCVGILKDWLGECLEYGLHGNVQIIDRKLADRFELTNREIITVVEDALIGEGKLADVSDAQVLDLLENGIILSSLDPGSRKNRPRPGQRKAKRDPVGRQY